MDQGQLLFNKIASLKRDPLAKEQSFEPKKRKTAYGNYTYIMA
jgi:hypothetical protein